jgi:DNA processing protein
MRDTDFTEQISWVALGQIAGIGSQTYCQLLRALGSPTDIFSASLSALKAVVTEKIAHDIRQGFDAVAFEGTKQWLSQNDNHLVTLADEHYPKALLQIADPPPFLYGKGKLALLNQASIAIVGSRNASVQGEKNAESFAEALCESGLCIVSGLALGIDGAAHRGALKVKGQYSGATIAVVGTGLDIVYPAKHRDLAHEIVQTGLIISEFPLGTPSKPQNFPKRNRIISGLSLGCLVVEANLQSGSQITARLAAEQGREVFAIPGSIHSPMAKGCHQLIKQGAKLVDSIADILSELKLEPNKRLQTEPNAIQDALNSAVTHHNSNENKLIELMGHEPMSVENLVALSHLTVNEVSSMLMILELEGSVASLAGGKYQKITSSI